MIRDLCLFWFYFKLFKLILGFYKLIMVLGYKYFNYFIEIKLGRYVRVRRTLKVRIIFYIYFFVLFIV